MTSITCVLAWALLGCCSGAFAFVVSVQTRGSHLVLPSQRNLFIRSTSAAPESSSTRKRHDGVNMRYVAMNRFKVKLGCEDEFEKVWRERESKLEKFSGFEQFMLLKVDHREDGDDEGMAAAKLGHTEFVSHTIWKHKLDFDEWRQSQAFKKSHVQSKMGDLMEGRPEPAMFDAVIIEPVPPEHQGGLWEFENEASYFDGDL